MKTAVVILNWNTRDYLRRFLPPLIKSTEGMDARVIVADSASTDGSMEVMEKEFPEVMTIPLDSNYGFTGGYNRALRGLDAEYFILINSDVEVPEGWLEPLVAWMEGHPECGVCGPKLHSLQERGRFEYAGAAGGYVDLFGYPFCRGRVLKRTENDTGQYDTPKDVLWVSGACLMVRSSVWRDLGGLDDRFFAHMEEIDFCWKAQRKGWRVTVVPQSTVYHLGGGTLPQDSPWKLRLNYRNNLLMLKNNLPATLRSRLIIAVRYLLDLMSGTVYLCTGKVQFARAVLDAHREYKELRTPFPADGKDCSGHWGICIVAASLLLGEGIFKHLKKYEDSH